MKETAYRSILVKPGQALAEASIPVETHEPRGIDSVAASRAPDAGLDEIDRALRSITDAVEDILEDIRCVETAIVDLKAQRQRRLAAQSPLALAERSLGSPAISRMERAVLTQLASGKSNREISDELGISEKTVKNHLWKAYRKLGVKSRTQLLRRLLSP
jgi:DNA-binding NarL/FixJ family response regulator